MRTGMWTISMLGMGFFFIGCSVSTDSFDCKDFCREYNECADASPQDCDAYCRSAERVNDSADCDMEWEILMDCMGGHQSAICDGTACVSEVEDWAGCAFLYCLLHIDDNELVCTSDTF